MRVAIAKQLDSVRRQIPANAKSEFFSTAWLDRPSALLPAATNPSGDCEAIPQAELSRMIAAAAAAEGVNARLIEAVVAQESGGRPCAISARGAQGLMQIMPATQVELGLSDPFRPAASLAAGARYLKLLIERYHGNLRLALAAYNAGASRVDSDRDVPRIAETEKYVTAILDKALGSVNPE